MRKLKKVGILLVIIAVFGLVVQVVMAEAMGIDLIGMFKNKVYSLADSSTVTVESQLEETKKKSLAQTSDYIDKLISDMRQNLNDFTVQETNTAKEKINAREKEIENTLNSQKQTLLDDSKTKIKEKIDNLTKQTLVDFDNEVLSLMKEKLK